MTTEPTTREINDLAMRIALDIEVSGALCSTTDTLVGVVKQGFEDYTTPGTPLGELTKAAGFSQFAWFVIFDMNMHAFAHTTTKAKGAAIQTRIQTLLNESNQLA